MRSQTSARTEAYVSVPSRRYVPPGCTYAGVGACVRTHAGTRRAVRMWACAGTGPMYANVQVYGGVVVYVRVPTRAYPSPRGHAQPYTAAGAHELEDSKTHIHVSVQRNTLAHLYEACACEHRCVWRRTCTSVRACMGLRTCVYVGAYVHSGLRTHRYANVRASACALMRTRAYTKLPTSGGVHTRTYARKGSYLHGCA